jgi:hypothetical protein
MAVLTACVLLGSLGLVLASMHTTGDYDVAAPVGGNNAGPGIEALLHGSLAGYVAHQPVVGLTSILLRLPFVALASALGAGPLGTYQVGVMACLLPLILVAAWLVTEPELSTKQRLVRFLAAAMVIQSPIIHNGLAAGHPEGVLSTVLGTVAVLGAMRGRARTAGLLLGLAISAKQTGLTALVPVLVALPGRRRQTAGIAGAVVLLLCGSVWLSDPDAFIRSLHGEGATRYLTPFSLLWPLSSPVHLGSQLSVARVMPAGLTRTPASALTLLAVGALATLWFVRATRRGASWHPLVLLVLMGLLRCLCDSTHEAYYWVSLLIPLAAWEASRDRVAVNTLLLNLAVLILYASLGRVAPGQLYAVSLAGEALLAFYLTRQAIALPDGRRHEVALLSSSGALGEPMAVACDA